MLWGIICVDLGHQQLRAPVQGSKGSLDNINLFSIITILSFLLLTPFALLRDGGFTFSASSMRGDGHPGPQSGHEEGYPGRLLLPCIPAGDRSSLRRCWDQSGTCFIAACRQQSEPILP